jgi:hypothetical protein
VDDETLFIGCEVLKRPEFVKERALRTKLRRSAELIPAGRQNKSQSHGQPRIP